MEQGTANSHYYTFSTFAQTLAGAIGFLAAVVLYKVQRLDDETAPYGDHLVRYWDDVDANDPNAEARAAWRSWRRRAYGEFLSLLRRTPAATQHPGRREHFLRFEVLVGQRNSLLSAFHWALALTVATMAGCGFVLISVHDFAPSSGAWILSLGYGAFLLCLASYTKVALQVFASPRDPKQPQ